MAKHVEIVEPGLHFSQMPVWAHRLRHFLICAFRQRNRAVIGLHIVFMSVYSYGHGARIGKSMDYQGLEHIFPSMELMASTMAVFLNSISVLSGAESI